MANQNIVDRIVGAGSPAQGTKCAPAVTLVATTEKLILDQTGATAVVAAFPNSAFATAGNFDTFCFRVRASFKTTTGGASTSIVNLYLGSSIVAGNKLATITSQSLSTASTSGFIEVQGIWDGTSQVISGYQSGAYGTGTPVSQAALANTAVSCTSQQALKFCISATNGSSVTGTTFQLGDFCVEAV